MSWLTRFGNLLDELDTPHGADEKDGSGDEQLDPAADAAPGASAAAKPEAGASPGDAFGAAFG
eukprot:CAMPEP_0176103886 /NCGR_PEP_ID=MMETSP0120_2-20121206/52122_1 /TAXON_ID=160619 /ORGANISM="Kryptoperidinium foliaceum, Strain CCMP 1326" /LENGTH=62 /DNA_ID=CAMNT_0017437977 /DNA_START=104 /DNA_END=289 /DNA_ORIENTATION=-